MKKFIITALLIAGFSALTFANSEGPGIGIPRPVGEAEIRLPEPEACKVNIVTVVTSFAEINKKEGYTITDVTLRKSKYTKIGVVGDDTVYELKAKVTVTEANSIDIFFQGEYDVNVNARFTTDIDNMESAYCHIYHVHTTSVN